MFARHQLARSYDRDVVAHAQARPPLLERGAARRRELGQEWRGCPTERLGGIARHECGVEERRVAGERGTQQNEVSRRLDGARPEDASEMCQRLSQRLPGAIRLDVRPEKVEQLVA
ncbi:hypothetical protein [Gemmatirosa kalamazoonensis]|uniref:hypothetical protein n=1 Tax=Gemmatirosa kalamazoonensis TaxID=861299 RepID=UPI001F3DFE40|nr:hypothetical protein [Gemmatirosa kalamazoonensis]